MQSQTTGQIIRISEQERTEVEQSLKASHAEYKEVLVLDEDGTELRAISMPHKAFIQERRRLAREREIAQRARQRGKGRK